MGGIGAGREARETQGQVWVITAFGGRGCQEGGHEGSAGWGQRFPRTVRTPCLALQGEVGAAQVSEVTLPVHQRKQILFYPSTVLLYSNLIFC